MHVFPNPVTYTEVQCNVVSAEFKKKVVFLDIFKPGAPAAGRRAWFLIITFVRECMRVCVCVCVYAPEAINY